MLFKKSMVFFVLMIALAAGLLFLPSLAGAADFDPTYIIADSEITDHNAMSIDEIKSFLDKRNGTLDDYLTFDKEGLPKTAVQAFFEIAQRWLINPKYLMVLTQKEQSLLESPNPSQKQYDWATGYGICDNCSMSDPNLERFKGFYRQVNSAAAQTRYYMDNIGEFNYQPGKTYNIDGTSVKIKNTATAALYNYTPHLHGNQVFFNLWTGYFEKKWPDGSLLVSSENDSMYYLENGVKRLIASKAVFASRFDSKQLIEVDPVDLSSYEDGPPIKYLNFSILKTDGGSDLFMIFGDTKRKIVSEAVFKKLGFQPDDIEMATADELKLYKDGPDITEYTAYPSGILLQDSQAKKPFEKLYYVISGEKHPVINKEIFDANFSGLKIAKVSAGELDKYMPAENVALPDGWLVKIKKVNTVYVISHGKCLPIFNGQVFEKMHYDKKNIKIITDETLGIHPIGQAVTGDW